MKKLNKKIIIVLGALSLVTAISFSTNAMKNETKFEETRKDNKYTEYLSFKFKENPTLKECINLYCALTKLFEENNIETDLMYTRSSVLSPFIEDNSTAKNVKKGIILVATTKENKNNLEKILSNFKIKTKDLTNENIKKAKNELCNHLDMYIEKSNKIIEKLENLKTDEEKINYIKNIMTVKIHKKYFNNKEKIEEELKKLDRLNLNLEEVQSTIKNNLIQEKSALESFKRTKYKILT